MQFNLSVTDTLGATEQFIIQRFRLFGGLFVWSLVNSGPRELSVVWRFLLFKEFVIRGSTVCNNVDSLRELCTTIYGRTLLLVWLTGCEGESSTESESLQYRIT